MAWRGVALLFCACCTFIWVPGPSKNEATDVARVFTYWRSHPSRLSEILFSCSRASREVAIPRRLLCAIALLEGYKRPALYQRTEVEICRVLMSGRFLGIRWWPDLSLGPLQMKLSTALWVRSGFREPVPLIGERMSSILAMVRDLEDRDTAMRYASRYLKHLSYPDETSRSGSPSPAPSGSSDVTIARVASRYGGGIPTGSLGVTPYGRVVEGIARKLGDLSTRSLDDLENCVIESQAD